MCTDTVALVSRINQRQTLTEPKTFWASAHQARRWIAWDESWSTCKMRKLQVHESCNERHQLLWVFARAQCPSGALGMATPLEHDRCLNAAYRLVGNNNCLLVQRDHALNICSLSFDQVMAAVSEPCEESDLGLCCPTDDEGLKPDRKCQYTGEVLPGKHGW